MELLRLKRKLIGITSEMRSLKPFNSPWMGLPQVSCLPNEIGQVFLNIIVNAAHAIAKRFGDNEGQEKGRITISSKALEDRIRITVNDNGAGVSADMQHKVFDPFFTTKELGEGTGQGLAIAYDIIVNKHGGTIDFDSVEGEGSTVTIHLPL